MNMASSLWCPWLPMIYITSFIVLLLSFYHHGCDELSWTDDFLVMLYLDITISAFIVLTVCQTFPHVYHYSGDIFPNTQIYSELRLAIVEAVQYCTLVNVIHCVTIYSLWRNRQDSLQCVIFSQYLKRNWSYPRITNKQTTPKHCVA